MRCRLVALRWLVCALRPMPQLDVGAIAAGCRHGRPDAGINISRQR